MRNCFSISLRAVAVAAFGLSTLGIFAQSPMYEVKREFDLRVPMRDGVTLSANVYRPDSAEKFPVLLVRTPYDAAQHNYAEAGEYWASHGYVYVIEDVRGRVAPTASSIRW